MPVEPYLFFNGCCEEALDFYQQAIGARLEMKMRFQESPDPAPEGRLPEGWGEKIMHASILAGDARIMLSDGNCSGEGSFRGFALSLAAPTEEDASRIFTALSNSGRIDMPIGRTFWSPCFGMVTDRFGVQWMVTVTRDEGAGM